MNWRPTFNWIKKFGLGRILLLPAIGLALAAATPAAGQPTLFPVVETKLTNGLRILTLEDHDCPIAEVEVWYHVGSADEPPVKQGFAHLFEHLMFRGTDRLGPTDHFDLLQSVGGHCNAYTAFDQTCYHESLPARQLELAFWLESERMAFLTVDATGFTTERKVVEEELRMYLKEPYGDLQAPALTALFGEQAYAHSPAGSIHDLRLATPPDVHSWWVNWYTPNNATLVVVGDVQAGQVKALAEKYFGWIPPVPPPARHILKVTPFESARAVVLKSENAPAPITGLVWRTVPLGDPDQLPLELLATILGGGESSRLYRRLVTDERMAVAALARPFSLERGGVFAAGAVLSPLGGDTQKALAAIKSELERLRAHGVTEEELEKARNQTVSELVLGAQTDEGKAQLIGQAAVLGAGLDELNARLERLRQLTTEDLLRAARTYLDPEHALTVTVPSSGLMGQLGRFLLGARATDEGTPAPFDTNVVLRGRPGVVRPAALPAHAPIAEGNSPLPNPTVYEDRLANGLRVLIAPRTNTPAVHLVLALPFGSCVEEKVGATAMTLALVTKATAQHDEKALAEELGLYAIELSGSADLDNCRIQATCLSEHSERAFSLLAEAATTPTFPQAAFKTALSQAMTELTMADNMPSTVADREFRRRFYAGHPYGREVSGQTADLNALRREDLVAHWRRVARPEQATLIITGALPHEQALALSEHFFGAWQGQDRSDLKTPAPAPYAEATHILLVDWPGAQQSEIRVGCPGLVETDPDKPVADLVGEYFGGSFGGRLNKAIRVANGGTYGAQGGFHASRLAGSFSIHTFTKTASSAETLRTVLAQIRDLTNRPPAPAELSLHQRYFLGSAAGRLETPEDMAGQLERDSLAGLPLDQMQRACKAMAAADATQCQALVHRLVDPARMLIVVVGDAKRIANELQSIAPVTVLDRDGKETKNKADAPAVQ
jgi:zinc protease